MYCVVATIWIRIFTTTIPNPSHTIRHGMLWARISKPINRIQKIISWKPTEKVLMRRGGRALFRLSCTSFKQFIAIASWYRGLFSLLYCVCQMVFFSVGEIAHHKLLSDKCQYDRATYTLSGNQSVTLDLLLPLRWINCHKSFSFSMLVDRSKWLETVFELQLYNVFFGLVLF